MSSLRLSEGLDPMACRDGKPGPARLMNIRDCGIARRHYSSSSPRKRRAVRGMIHYVAVHARFNLHEAGTFWLSRLRKGPGMRFCDSIFGRLLKPISRVQLAAAVSRHDGNAYDKVFKSWDHLVALVFAQLAGVDSLRSLEAAWNAHAHHHYH